MSSIRRINCENCGAPYAINVATLRKEKNTVTCRRCKHKMIVYKSGFSEPVDEQARIVQDDEKTLIDEEPKMQQDMPVLETEISSQPPPMSLSSNVRKGDTEEVENRFEQTARPEDFVPLHSRQSLREELKEDPTTPRPRHNISPRDAGVKPAEGGSTGGRKVNIETKFTKASPSKKKSKTSTTSIPAGLSLSLTVVAAMLFMAMLSSFAQYYMQDEIGQKISLIVSISSLMLAFFLIVTSSFGKKSASTLISASLSAVTTIALGAGLFLVGAETNNQVVEIEKEEKEQLVVKKEDTELSDVKEIAEKIEEKDQTANINTDKKTSVSSRQATKRSKAVAEAFNPRMKSSEPSMERPAEEEKMPVIDPLDEEMPEPDMNFDDMDLDLDAEEEKPSRFARKEKKPEPKVEAKKKPAPKVEIPQSVMDIIIRNNKDVKGCYVSHRAEHGDFPKKVEVLFTLQPSGKVSQAYIAEGPHVGSKFESCLRSAFKKMTFPAFDSAATPQSLRYTLKI